MARQFFDIQKFIPGGGYMTIITVIVIGVACFAAGWFSRIAWACYSAPQIRCIFRKEETIELAPVKLQVWKGKIFFRREDGTTGSMVVNNLHQHRKSLTDAIKKGYHVHVRILSVCHYGDKIPIFHKYIGIADPNHLFAV